MNRRTWKYLLSVIWVVIIIHFLKDITQDILHIPTILDVFGNIQEDVGWLPKYLQWFVYGAGVGSFLAEIFLLVAIPKVQKRDKVTVLEKWVIGVIGFMLIYFPVVILLDPAIIGDKL